MTDEKDAPVALDDNTQALLSATVRDCGHAECQEVLAELKIYGRRLTPNERLTHKGDS